MKKKPASDPRAIARRKYVILRLENQLKNGIKVIHGIDEKKHHVVGHTPLTDKDRERIGKELEILKKRL